MSTLALSIRFKFAPTVWTFVPVKSQPIKRIQYPLFRFRRTSNLISVLYTLDKLAAVLMSETTIK